MAWTIRHSSGYLCAPMPDEVADRLELPLMVADNRDPLRTAYTVSVDAAAGVTTGISAADRLRTVQVLADADATPADLIRPGPRPAAARPPRWRADAPRPHRGRRRPDAGSPVSRPSASSASSSTTTAR